MTQGEKQFEEQWQEGFFTQITKGVNDYLMIINKNNLKVQEIEISNTKIIYT